MGQRKRFFRFELLSRHRYVCIGRTINDNWLSTERKRNLQNPTGWNTLNVCAFTQKKWFEYGIRRTTKQRTERKKKKHIFFIGLRESMDKNREKQPKNSTTIENCVKEMTKKKTNRRKKKQTNYSNYECDNNKELKPQKIRFFFLFQIIQPSQA